MDPESSGIFSSTFDMTSSAEERIKMAPNRGTADRIWVILLFEFVLFTVKPLLGENKSSVTLLYGGDCSEV